MRTVMLATIISLLRIAITYAAVPSAEEYANALKIRFVNGESSSSIRSSFETNELYDIYEILPYCYDYSVDTNDVEGSVSRYKTQHEFIGSLLPHGPIEVSSNVYALTVEHLRDEEQRLVASIRREYDDNPSPQSHEYWQNLYPKAFSFLHSGPPEKGFYPWEARLRTKNAHDLIKRMNSFRSVHMFQTFLNLDSYTNIFSRAELYAALSTNALYNADAMFKYCLTEKSDFATNNIAIAEKQIWRNNFVLEIVRHSCNLHTNETNRALNTAYTNRLAILRAYYEAIPEPHLGMIGAELDEWRARLGNTIDAYTNGISPFKSPEQGDR